MSTFAYALRGHIGKASFTGVTRNGLEEAIFTVDTDACSLLLVYNKDNSSCSLWKFSLDDRTMTKHAEDDVGISDPAGIATFASYFHEALSRPLFVDGSDAFYPGNIEANQLALRLDYRIGSMPIESNLLLEAVQRNADIGFYRMMRVLFLNDPSKTSVSWSSSKSMVADTGLTSAASFSNVYSSIELENNVKSSIPAEPEPVESDEVITAAVKAKKRKATGVNLLLNKKR